MNIKLTYAQRATLAENITFFLIGKGLDVLGTFEGKLTKKEQMNAFGFYMGKGTIIVNGDRLSVLMRVRTSYGQESEITCSIGANYSQYTNASCDKVVGDFYDYLNKLQTT